MRTSRKIIYLVVFATFILTLGACQRELFTYKGNAVSEDRRIIIRNGGPHAANCGMDKVNLNYEYTRHEGCLP